MPELPEVETMCRGLSPVIGRKIASVTAPPCKCRPIAIQPALPTIAQLLEGCRVEHITRLGKRVLLETSSHALILQPKMTGLVSLDTVPDPDHLRLRIDFKGRPKLKILFWDRRGLGTVELLPLEQIQSRIVEGRLGPDALQISLNDFVSRLCSTRRAIKVALLDQKLLAGVGNLYASEMLHHARIHPEQPAQEISFKQANRLYMAMREILLTAIEHEGSTLSDGTYRNALNDPGSYQNHHRVYDREGQACSTCQASKIVRIIQAQRSTFYCRRCQKLPKAKH